MNIGVSNQFCENGEQFTLGYINQQLQPGIPVTVFDVGANTGEYTLQVLSCLKDPYVYCFEPAQKAFESLRTNLSQHPNVELHNFGFSDQESRVKLFYDVEASEMASVYKRRLDHFKIRMDLSEDVRLTTLDSFCAQKGIEHITFLKLDVEGHELNVFKGARELLNSQSIDFIQFEFGGCNIDSRTFLQDFYYYLSPCYELFRIVKDGFIPLPDYSERLEIFMYSNFFAVSRKFVDRGSG